MSEVDVKKTSIAKSLVAQSKPRVGGRFVSANPDGLPKRPRGRPKKNKEDQITKEELLYDTRLLTEEEKEYIDGDALRFYEVALKKARTPAEARHYASVLIKYQYPSLSSVTAKQEVEVTHKVLVWDWPDADKAEEFTLIEQEDESTENNRSLQAETDTGMDTQEP